jgi:pSer/pThr/pTyr-binding forkhead associated (FHA) protein
VTEDIVLNGNGVSSRHARLTQRGVAVYVEDLNTPSGTFVNGERIPANFPVALYNEDQVAFGEVLLRVERSR